MGSLYLLSRQCLLGFETLTSHLVNGKPDHVKTMPIPTIKNQGGKLRVWCGNLGALQTGYSSLDYRLRESTVMQSTVSKLLRQLSSALLESTAVVSGARLPFEDQPKPADLSEESTDDSDCEEGPGPRKELAMRMSSIVDCLNNLYRLSYKIRNSTLRPTTTKAILHKEIDVETNVDIFDKLHEFDEMHVYELLRLLRQGRDPPVGFEEFLVPRLAATITHRRRCFKYWEKHSKKLSREVEVGEIAPGLRSLDLSDIPLGPQGGNACAQGTARLELPFAIPESVTILSKTDATPYDPNLDDRTERETVMSSASTALDTAGKGIDLPGPPLQAIKGEDFTCPYCHVLCPPKQGRGKAWRQHVLHDLQPYVCTYRDCPQPNELYRSRSQWVRHEDSAHRQCWRCFEHPDHVYVLAAGLRGHLASDHTGNLTEAQMEDLMDVYSSTRVDDREYCPICFLKQPFDKGMANHLANHLERAALFALPRSQTEMGESDGGSGDVHGGRVGSRSSLDTVETVDSVALAVPEGSQGDAEIQNAIPRYGHETNNIFVSGISQETTDREFREYFQQFGFVIRATLLTVNTGLPGGSGFVTFESEASVDVCMNTSPEIHGKPMAIIRLPPTTQTLPQ